MAKSRHTLFAWITMLVIVVCLTTIAVFSGFRHSTEKLESILATILLVFALHTFLADPICFLLAAVADALWTPAAKKYAPDAEAVHQNRLDYLKLRRKSLRAHLWVPEKYRDERLNLKYYQMVLDLWLYGWFFIFLVCLVGEMLAKNAYYNFENIRHLFFYNHSNYYGLSSVYEMVDAYDFIESSLIKAFHSGQREPDTPVWVHSPHTQLLGIVKLRQLRITQWTDHVTTPPFSSESYLPGWKLPFEEVPYFGLYRRIYLPWIPYDRSAQNKAVLNGVDKGYIRSYPYHSAYEVFLTRKREHSLKLMRYLRRTKWLNYNTSALFMELVLYSTDATLLTLVVLCLEQTPFGGVFPHIHVKTFDILEHLENLTYIEAVLIVGYAIMFLQFLKTVTLKLWFDPRSVRNVWNKVDIIIVLLNMIISILYILQMSYVSKVLEHIENASKSEFLQAETAAGINEYFRLFLGLLVCIATLRLWKALEFSAVFQLFTYTLFLAWRAVLSVAIAIIIFITGFGLAVCTINGNSSILLYTYTKSIVCCTCYAFGIGTGVTSRDYTYGGAVLGIILFAILSFVITIILMNVFVSLISDFFSVAKNQQDTKTVPKISLFELMYAESAHVILWFQRFRIFRKHYKRNNRTVSENVLWELNRIISKNKMWLNPNTFLVARQISQSDLQSEIDEFKNQQERTYTIGALLNTQIDVLETLSELPTNDLII